MAGRLDDNFCRALALWPRPMLGRIEPSGRPAQASPRATTANSATDAGLRPKCRWSWI